MNCCAPLCVCTRIQQLTGNLILVINQVMHWISHYNRRQWGFFFTFLSVMCSLAGWARTRAVAYKPHMLFYQCHFRQLLGGMGESPSSSRSYVNVRVAYSEGVHGKWRKTLRVAFTLDAIFLLYFSFFSSLLLCLGLALRDIASRWVQRSDSCDFSYLLPSLRRDHFCELLRGGEPIPSALCFHGYGYAKCNG